MTHTDRDRSEPVWPPHARNAYQQPDEPSEREQRYADSMIQFYGDGVVASPEEHRHRFARAVMKVADAEQAELRAEVERLKRERDNIGCSRFTCADDLGRANRAHDAQKERAEAAERALADERAKVARVESLAAEYEERSSDTENAEHYPWGVAADDIRAALAGDA